MLTDSCLSWVYIILEKMFLRCVSDACKISPTVSSTVYLKHESSLVLDASR